MQFYKGPTGNAFPKHAQELCSRCRWPAAAHRRDQNRERMLCPEDLEPRGSIVGVGRSERGWTATKRFCDKCGRDITNVDDASADLCDLCRLRSTDATSSAPVPKAIQKRMREVFVPKTPYDERFEMKAALMQAVRLLDEARRQMLPEPRIRELEERVARLRNQLVRESREEQIYTNGADAPRVIFDPEPFVAGRRAGKSQLIAAAGRIEKKKKTAPKPSTAPSNQPRRYYEE